MGKLKNVVKSSQLWQIISLWMSIQKFQNFAHSSFNSPFTQTKTNIENKYLGLRISFQSYSSICKLNPVWKPLDRAQGALSIMGYLYQWKGKLNQKMFSLSQKMILLSVPSHSGGSAYVFVCQRRITQDDICTGPSFWSSLS